MAKQKIWYEHLVVDYGFYAWVVNGFWNTHTFGQIPNNSYLPGSLFFFLLPGLSLLISKNNWPLFVNTFIAANIILILAHFFIYRLFNKNSSFYFVLILLFSGPILFYRHEFFPSLLVLTSLYFWKKEYYHKSSFMLGLAFATKVYPIIIFPYYLILVLKRQLPFRNNLKFIISLSVMFITGVLVLFIPFFLQGSPPSEIVRSFVFNSEKPVHIESFWASLLTLKEWIPGRADQNGIYGLDMTFVKIPLAFFNYFWIFPMVFFYFYIFKKMISYKLEIPFLIILLFLIFSKVIAPQYMLWAFLLLPLFKPSLLILIISGSILVLTQYIYPLHYNDLIWGYYINQSHPLSFYLLALRNLMMIVLFIMVFKTLKYDKKYIQDTAN